MRIMSTSRESIEYDKIILPQVWMGRVRDGKPHFVMIDGVRSGR